MSIENSGTSIKISMKYTGIDEKICVTKENSCEKSAEIRLLAIKQDKD
jgi:hypothetical protein